MRRALLLLALLAAAGDARAQGLSLFPASQYGKATLTLPQSTAGMSSVQLQNVLGRNANFERLDSYRDQDRFRRIATPVGRLDLLVSGPLGTGVANCTASIISARHIITNAHCFPQGAGAVKQASLLMDFYSEDNAAQGRRFEVRPVPVERNEQLDFVVAEVSGNPSARFGRIALEARDPEPGESLLIIHHPMGMPKHMTRGGCRAHAPVAVQGTDIWHRCDTMPGSSGSPILAEGTGRMLGLHYGGALDAQVHVAADEPEARVGQQHAGHEPRLGEDLEPVAHAEHGNAGLGARAHLAHDRGVGGDRAGPQVVAVGEAAGQDDEVGRGKRRLRVPDDGRLRAGRRADRVDDVALAVGAREDDDC